MNDDGLIFPLDFLFYVVLLSLILALIGFCFVGVDDYSRESFSESYVDVKLDEITALLLDSEGVPSNWEFLSSDDIGMIGFKSVNSSDISFFKIDRLCRDAFLIDSYLPEGMACSVLMYPASNPDDKTFIVSEYASSYYKNVKSSSNVIFIDWGYDILAIDNNNLSFNYPFYHNTKFDKYYCNSFCASRDKLTHGRYYLISNSTSDYVLTNTYGGNVSSKFKYKKDITDDIKSLFVNDSVINMTLFVHVSDSAYVVYDAYDNPDNLDYVINNTPFILEIKVYY